MANNLRIDDNTVRIALERMQKSGFLKTWSASLNPHALGMECCSILVRAGEGTSSKQKIISQLKLVEGVVLIMSFLDDPSFRLIFYYKDKTDLERKIGLISSICGADKPSAVWNIPFPQCRMKLKKTDWQMSRLLLKDSRKKVSEIAKETRVSARTVRRRFALMTEDISFFPNPIVDVKKVNGFVYLFVVSYHNKKENKFATDAALRKEIERIIFLDTNAEYYTVIAAVFKNISEANKISDWLKAQEGVNEVIVRLVEDMISVSDWIEQEIERRLK